MTDELPPNLIKTSLGKMQDPFAFTPSSFVSKWKWKCWNVLTLSNFPLFFPSCNHFLRLSRSYKYLLFSWMCIFIWMYHLPTKVIQVCLRPARHLCFSMGLRAIHPDCQDTPRRCEQGFHDDHLLKVHLLLLFSHYLHIIPLINYPGTWLSMLVQATDAETMIKG